MLESFALSTYSVYLLHPIIYRFLQPLVGMINNNMFTLCALAVLTVIVARIVYEVFELKFIRIGKSFADDHFRKTNASWSGTTQEKAAGT